MFDWYPWMACSFLKGSRGGVDLGRGEMKVGNWEEWGRGNSNRDAIMRE